jgi:hypothetical protein
MENIDRHRSKIKEIKVKKITKCRPENRKENKYLTRCANGGTYPNTKTLSNK